MRSGDAMEREAQDGIAAGGDEEARAMSSSRARALSKDARHSSVLCMRVAVRTELRVRTKPSAEASLRRDTLVSPVRFAVPELVELPQLPSDGFLIDAASTHGARASGVPG